MTHTAQAVDVAVVSQCDCEGVSLAFVLVEVVAVQNCRGHRESP